MSNTRREQPTVSRTGAARIACGLLALAASAAGQVSFTNIGMTASGTQIPLFKFSVSGDGAVVVGEGPGSAIYRWTPTGSLELLGTPDGSIMLFGLAVSTDGQVIVGTDWVPVQPGSSVHTAHAFRWTAATGFVGLGAPVADGVSEANAVNADGSKLVGVGTHPDPSQCQVLNDYKRAATWSLSAGWELLPACESGIYYSSCTGVSGDGSVIAGGGSGNLGAEAWRSVDGGLLQSLGTLAGGQQAYSWASAVSLDGSTIVGHFGQPGMPYNETELQHPFRWTAAGGMEDLGVPHGGSGGAGTYATSVSADGSVVVGTYSIQADVYAFLWTASLGMVDLTAYLAQLGVDLTGTLFSAYVSADGSTIVGNQSSVSTSAYRVHVAGGAWPKPWPDLGNGLAGVAGNPRLIGLGDPTPGSSCSLTLSHAAVSAQAVLFLSTSAAPTPFKGGMLLPVPPLAILPMATYSTGSIPLAFAWPAGLPSGLSLTYQYAIADAAAVHGVALSNAVQSNSP